MFVFVERQGLRRAARMLGVGRQGVGSWRVPCAVVGGEAVAPLKAHRANKTLAQRSAAAQAALNREITSSRCIFRPQRPKCVHVASSTVRICLRNWQAIEPCDRRSRPTMRNATFRRSDERCRSPMQARSGSGVSAQVAYMDIYSKGKTRVQPRIAKAVSSCRSLSPQTLASCFGAPPSNTT